MKLSGWTGLSAPRHWKVHSPCSPEDLCNLSSRLLLEALEQCGREFGMIKSMLTCFKGILVGPV
jgi:hypothetical protein